MLNLDIDDYTKTLNRQKILRKTKKKQLTENQKNTKTEI